MKCKHIQDKEINDYLDVILQSLRVLHVLRHCEESFMPTWQPSDMKSLISGLPQPLKGLRNDELYINAKKQLAVKELIANQISLFNVRIQIAGKQGNICPKAERTQASILNELGFELTIRQKQVIEEIEWDQNSKLKMMRLLQGDVGIGKTLVALLTMINTAEVGFQAALIAPTDLLAYQHYEFFVKALKNTGIWISLLTGKILGSAWKNIMAQLENGEIDILISTHALFQEKVNFKKLGYIVIDEQHKFGVQQRLDLISKGVNPDVLVMTATPIPRSLALTMFGDMTISKLQGKPKDRLPIATNTMSTNKIEDIIEAINRKLIVGERIYWICHLIEQSDKEERVENNLVMDMMNRFSSIEKIYKGCTGIIHGKMKNKQKDLIMKQFKDGEIKILVATTVIEVGIDVPDATLIIIENAERFGLAQLHQLRGRVGRGSLQSYCILLYNPKRVGKVARGRFEIMKQTNDGFYIAEQDLKHRGSGEILGIKQSGEMDLFFADLADDYDLLLKANKFAEIGAKDNLEFVNFQIKLFAKSQMSELMLMIISFRLLSSHEFYVIPAKAGIQKEAKVCFYWIPAFAGNDIECTEKSLG